jgi:hypothetical protein
MNRGTTDLRPIDNRLLAAVSGGQAEDPAPEGRWKQVQRWVERQDVINYGVGVATGFAIGPIVAHLFEDSWKLMKAVPPLLHRLRKP